MLSLLLGRELAADPDPGPDEIEGGDGRGEDRRSPDERLGQAGPGDRADDALEDRRDLLVGHPPVLAEAERGQGERELGERRELADEPRLDVGGRRQLLLDRGPIGRAVLERGRELRRKVGRRLERGYFDVRCVHRRIPRGRSKGPGSAGPPAGFGSGAGGGGSPAGFARGRNRWVTGSRSSVDASARARSARTGLLTFVRFAISNLRSAGV
jgi:hypothetical protein